MMKVKKVDGFDVAAYRARLRVLRELIVGDADIADFAARLGVPFKRWHNYERGYPVPRETAFLLHKKFGISVEWLWWGKTGNLLPEHKRKIDAIERFNANMAAMDREVEKAQVKRKKFLERSMEQGSRRRS